MTTFNHNLNFFTSQRLATDPFSDCRVICSFFGFRFVFQGCSIQSFEQQNEAKRTSIKSEIVCEVECEGESRVVHSKIGDA